MSSRVLRVLLAAVLTLSAGAVCQTQTAPPGPAVQTPPDTLWVGPLATRWIVDRSARGLPVPIYPASGFVAPVLLTLDGTVLVSPVADSYESGGYFPLTEMIEPQLAELPQPPASFRDLQRYAALSGAGLWLWTWRLADYAPLAAANGQTRWSLPDHWLGDRSAPGDSARANLTPIPPEAAGSFFAPRPASSAPATAPAAPPAEPYLPIVASRLPKLPSLSATNLATLAAWFEIAGPEPRKFLADDPLAGLPYAHPPALSPHAYIFPLKVLRHGQLPSPVLPLQDRLSLPDPVGRLVAFSTIALEGRQPGSKYNELYAIAMASNVSPLGRTNALLAIGTIPEPRQTTLLLTLLREPDPKISEAAAYQIGLSRLTPLARDLAAIRQARPHLRDVTAWALARLASADLQKELLNKLAAEGNGSFCPLTPGELVALGALLANADQSHDRMPAAIRVLAALAGNHADPAVRRAAVLALVQVPEGTARDELGRLLVRNLVEPTELSAVITRLANDGPPGLALLLSAWPTGSTVTRAALGLGFEFAGEAAVPLLADKCCTVDAPVPERQAAIFLLARLPKTPAAVTALQNVVPRLRGEAAAVLTLWNEPLPAAWPTGCRTLTAPEVARGRMSAPLASQPASAPAIP